MPFSSKFRKYVITLCITTNGCFSIAVRQYNDRKPFDGFEFQYKYQIMLYFRGSHFETLNRR